MRTITACSVWIALATWAGAAESCRWTVAPEDAKARCDVGAARIYPPDDQPFEVAVTTDAGQRVGAQVLWQAAGQPAEVLFDSSAGAATYVIACGTHLAAGAPGWEPQAGMTLETRFRTEGAVDNWEQLKAVWEHSQPVQGRSLVPTCFDGLNRHGPIDNFCSYYRGFVQIAQAGDYVFATVSDDGSAMFVDHKLIADWYGWHGPGEGMRGEHHGAAQLAAGRHLVEYYHVQGGGGTCAEIAWKPPGHDRFEVLPAEAIAPVARYACRSVDLGKGTDVAIGWEVEGHCRIDDRCLVDVKLHAYGAEAATWTFDDGQTATGTVVEHTFPRAGARRVRLEAKRAGQGTVRERVIDAHPFWTQEHDFDPHWKQARARLVAYDAAKIPGEDLGELIAFADAIPDGDLVKHLVAGGVAAKDALAKAGDAGLRLGLRLQQPDLKQYQAARDVLRACAAGSPDAGIAAHARLHLAGLLVHVDQDAAGAAEALAAIPADALKGDDARLRAIYEGDVALAKGDVEAARGKYLAAGTVVPRGDLQYALRRRARLEAARDYLSAGDPDSAEGVVRAVEWETPVERLGTETGLLLGQVWLKRGELPYAATRCRFMLVAAPEDPHRPEVLLLLARVAIAGGHADEAGAVAKKLRAEHPYSEAAAVVKELVPVGAKR